jgi:hypothetical protein
MVRMWRRGPSIVVVLPMLAVLAAALAGCTFDATERGTADVEVRLTDDGAADIRAVLSHVFTGDPGTLGGSLARALFPQAGRADVTVQPNTGGRPFPRVHVAAVYRPGPRVHVPVDAAAALAVLAAAGMDALRLTVCGPAVPVTITATVPPDRPAGRCGSWTVGPGAAAPAVTVGLRPAPVRWWAILALVVAAATAVALASVSLARPAGPVGGRWRPVVFGVAGTVAGGIGVFVAPGAQADNLGAAGRLSGVPLQAAGVTGLLVLPLGIAAFILTMIAVQRRVSDPAR